MSGTDFSSLLFPCYSVPIKSPVSRRHGVRSLHPPGAALDMLVKRCSQLYYVEGLRVAERLLELPVVMDAYDYIMWKGSEWPRGSLQASLYDWVMKPDVLALRPYFHPVVSLVVTENIFS
ncbi:hypothetical protein J6590_016990 [Homalodisca vitripennis]|nr:hypothetical protein J6590_016990 [Homalodisca vitripennis]